MKTNVKVTGYPSDKNGNPIKQEEEKKEDKK